MSNWVTVEVASEYERGLINQVEALLVDYCEAYPRGVIPRDCLSQADYGKYENAEYALRNSLEKLGFRADWNLYGNATVRLNGCRRLAFSASSRFSIGKAAFSWLEKARAKIIDDMLREVGL